MASYDTPPATAAGGGLLVGSGLDELLALADGVGAGESVGVGEVVGVGVEVVDGEEVALADGVADPAGTRVTAGVSPRPGLRAGRRMGIGTVPTPPLSPLAVGGPFLAELSVG